MINLRALRKSGLPAESSAGGRQVARRSRRVLAGLLACGIYAAPAQAYLDPGTGSILLQGLLAAIAAAAAVCGVFWHRVKSFFASIFSPKKTPPAPGDPDRDP